MLTMISTVLSFLMGGLPKLLDAWQDSKDKSHEIKLASMQTERELMMHKEGLVAQQKVEEIRLEELKVDAEVRSQEVAMKQHEALLAHDTASAIGASTWVINARAMVRPGITYGMFLLLLFVDVFGFWYAFHTGVGFETALNLLWDDESQQIFASIIAFYFGGQAFKK
jgi:hypothetical protein